MSEEKRSIGYICPVCGQAVVAERTLFRLLAGDSAVPCPCGKSELSVRQTGDRCEVTVPCLFCARDHRAACSNEGLKKQKLIALTCGKSGLAICHIGEEGQVFRAMEKLEEARDKPRLLPQRRGHGRGAGRAAGHRRPGRRQMRLRLRPVRREGGVLLGGRDLRRLRGGPAAAGGHP